MILFEDAFVYGMSIIQIGKHIDRYARDARSFALTKSTPSHLVAPPTKQPANQLGNQARASEPELILNISRTASIFLVFFYYVNL